MQIAIGQFYLKGTINNNKTCTNRGYKLYCEQNKKMQQKDTQNSELIQEFKYKSSDGHAKATIEQVFGPVMEKSTGQNQSQMVTDDTPWTLSWQMSERNVAWSDDLRVSILKHSAANDLGISKDIVDERLKQISLLIPEIQSRLKIMKIRDLTAFLADPNSLAKRLFTLKQIFPTANVGEMLLKRVSLGLNEDLDQLAKGVQEMREMLPRVDFDHLAQQNPVVLSFRSFKNAIDDAKRMMPDSDLQLVLNRNPSIILALQRGEDMIPYDPVPGQQ
eukprot:TRINITY_DN2139_c0_g1_i3.p1 TRINITY_DN2139_c0_g1~~TRINITY_DN2139_c0_g1_i3.p1  ORF type:complete len:289 (-),score=38.00 TRINITY_DN2139_c0_g1_i3:140-964(-)